MSVGMEEAKSGEGGEGVVAPLVFQCIKCNTIIGDSWSFQSSDKDLKSITLNAISSVYYNEKNLHTSSTGKDLGSTYYEIHCEICHIIIGKVYKTTSRELDPIRDLYTLFVEQLRSYQLGSGDKKVNIDDLKSQSQQEISENLNRLQVDIHMAKKILLQHNERIEALEDAQGITWEDETNDSQIDPFNNTNNNNTANNIANNTPNNSQAKKRKLNN